MGQFLIDKNIFPLNVNVVLECVKIRRSIKIKTPDAIIAAFAIVNHLTHETNDSDFNRVDSLSIVNPHDL